MTEPYRQGVMEMLSKRTVDVRDPSPASIHIEDFAYGLARIPRYFGQTKKNYSVAEHSFLLSMVVGEDPVTCLSALVDDASEAYLGDLTAPVISLPELAPYRLLHRKFMVAVRQSLGLPRNPPRIIHQRDLELRVNELHVLRGYKLRDDESLLPVKLCFWGAEKAEQMFLERFVELQ